MLSINLTRYSFSTRRSLQTWYFPVRESPHLEKRFFYPLILDVACPAHGRHKLGVGGAVDVRGGRSHLGMSKEIAGCPDLLHL